MRWLVPLFAIALYALPATGQEMPRARQVARALDQQLLAWQRDTDDQAAIAKAADAFAQAWIEAGQFGIRGHSNAAKAIRGAWTRQPGAFQSYLGQTGKAGEPALLVADLTGDSTELAALADSAKDAGVVIILGRRSALTGDSLGADAMRVDTDLRQFAAALQQSEQPDRVSRADHNLRQWSMLVRSWQFQAEIFAACTRHGKVPIVMRSVEDDTRKLWLKRYGQQAFHHDRWLDPIQPGVLGREYLAQVRKVLRELSTGQWDDLAKVRDQLDRTRVGGGTVHLHTGGSVLPYLLPDMIKPVPGWQLLHGGKDAPTAGDFILAVGGSAPPGHAWWGDHRDYRIHSVGLAWLINRFDSRPSHFKPGELLVDLWGPVGDSAVKVEHYDARLGPVTNASALMAVALLIAEQHHMADPPANDGALAQPSEPVQLDPAPAVHPKQ